MKLHKSNGLHRELEAMDIHRLNQLLQRELEKPAPEIDEERVRAILKALEKQEVRPLPEDRAVREAHDKYRAQSKPPAGRKPRGWVLRICVAAAVLCLVLTAIPRASGENGLVEFVVRVTEDVVAFFSPGHTDDQQPPDYTTQHPGLEALRQTMAGYGVTVSVVPFWIDEAYELTDLKTEVSRAKIRVHAYFETDDRMIVFYYEIYGSAVTHEFIKNEEACEEYEAANIIHKIYTNNEKQFVLWNRENVKCSIVVDGREENLTKILDSIYKMEDQ